MVCFRDIVVHTLHRGDKRDNDDDDDDDATTMLQQKQIATADSVHSSMIQCNTSYHISKYNTGKRTTHTETR